jgi:beta-aspartyl-peptidase (threonine type)
MPKLLALAALLLMPFAAAAQSAAWAIAIHGGAGVMDRKTADPATEAAVRAALGDALDAGAEILRAGGSALDAAEASVRRLEASPLFNAGHGAVLTSAGTVELDAAIMDGETLRAGAVTGVTTTRSPIALARRLLADGPHVFLAGEAADRYAAARGLEQVENSFFVIDRRRRDLERWKGGAALEAPGQRGTVGAVARDARGNLAAATSTGGLTGKSPGRIGDAPVIGAGTLADNRCGAVSATGSGEIFLRAQAAAQICARARFGGETLAAAARATLADIAAMGGSGGVILLGPAGEADFAMNSPGMYRARTSAGGARTIAIYADE